MVVLWGMLFGAGIFVAGLLVGSWVWQMGYRVGRTSLEADRPKRPFIERITIADVIPPDNRNKDQVLNSMKESVRNSLKDQGDSSPPTN